MVSYVAQEPLLPNVLPRKITVYLAAPPGDSIRTAREHFTEYIKPILVAGGVDWDVVEGRREGEVRAGLAERVRRLRRRKGEKTVSDGASQCDEKSKEVDREDTREKYEAIRARMGLQEQTEVGGDIVIGRHTWKEYVRGLHEGWLGPVDLPKEDVEPANDSPAQSTYNPPGIPTKLNAKLKQGQHHDDVPATPDSEVLLSPKSDPLTNKNPGEKELDPSTQEFSADSATSTGSPQSSELSDDSENEVEKKAESPPKPLVSLPHNHPDEYPASTLPASFPAASYSSLPAASTSSTMNTPSSPPSASSALSSRFQPLHRSSQSQHPAPLPRHLPPSNPLPHRHILGFFNTPIRIYRFLTRRYTADEIGRQTAAVVLGLHRPYKHYEADSSDGDAGITSDGIPPAIGASGTALSDAAGGDDARHVHDWEQPGLLENEEAEWHKSVRKAAAARREASASSDKQSPTSRAEDGFAEANQRGAKQKREDERVWLDPMVVDERIGSAMRRFELSSWDEDRAERIGKGASGVPGRPVGEDDRNERKDE